MGLHCFEGFIFRSNSEASFISSHTLLLLLQYLFIHFSLFYVINKLSDYSFLLCMSHNILFLIGYWFLFGFVKGSKSQSEQPPILPPLSLTFFNHAVLFMSISLHFSHHSTLLLSFLEKVRLLIFGNLCLPSRNLLFLEKV